MDGSVAESRIELLDAGSAQLVTAHARIGSYWEAAGGLVARAVEAGATFIRVDASPEALRLCVEDDGEGIANETLELAFSDGVLSKSADSVAQGNFLAALSRIASVEVNTKCAGKPPTLKCARQGQSWEPLSAEGHLIKDHGTRVDVWEMFPEVPVRRQLTANPGHGVQDQIIEVQNLVAVHAIFAPSVGFDLRDGRRTLLTMASTAESAWKDRVCSVLGNQTAVQLYRLQGHSADGLTFDGFASKEPLAPTSAQGGLFVAINGRPLLDPISSDTGQMILRAWKGGYTAAGNRDDVPHRRRPVVVLRLRCAASRVALSSRGGLIVADFSDPSAVLAALDALFREFFGARRVRSRAPTPTKAAEWTSQFGFWVTKRPRILVPQRPDHAEGPEAKFRDCMLDLKRGRRLGERHPSHESARKADADDRPVSLEERLKSVAPDWVNPCAPYQPRVEGSSRARRVEEPARGFRYDVGMFPKMRVIGSCEHRLTVVALPSSVHVLDQHAADERIRLEALQKRIRGGNITCVVQRSAVGGGVRVTLSPAEHETLASARWVLEDLGWQLQRPSGHSGEHTYEILSVPNIGGVVLDDPSAIHEVLEDAALEGAHSVLIGKSRTMQRVLASAACRSAIVFGDTLTDSARDAMVSRLAQCALPFQCAHGRPSMVPLVRFHETERHSGVARRAGTTSRIAAGIRELMRVRRDAEKLDQPSAIVPP